MSRVSQALEQAAAGLERRLPGQVERCAPSAPLVTYRCGGPLAVLVRAAEPGDLIALAETIGQRPNVPVLVIGRGSNLLVADSGFPGVALLLGGAFETVEPDVAGATVRAGGAAPLPVLARRAAAAGLGGLEFYVGIPGSVGGAVRMNAGGHGSDTRQVLVSARVADLASGGRARDLPAGDLGLGYRHSDLTGTDVVVQATFATVPADPAACEARIDDIVRWRRENQPGGSNAGSVFRNPPGDSAGRLIDACGLKGRRFGGASVSAKHANFFVAEQGATAGDVMALIDDVRSRVEAETGVRLECELRTVGFDDAGGGAR